MNSDPNGLCVVGGYFNTPSRECLVGIELPSHDGSAMFLKKVLANRFVEDIGRLVF